MRVTPVSSSGGVRVNIHYPSRTVADSFFVQLVEKYQQLQQGQNAQRTTAPVRKISSV